MLSRVTSSVFNTYISSSSSDNGCIVLGTTCSVTVQLGHPFTIPLGHPVIVPLATIPQGHPDHCATLSQCSGSPYNWTTLLLYHWAILSPYYWVTISLGHPNIIPLCHPVTIPLGYPGSLYHLGHSVTTLDHSPHTTGPSCHHHMKQCTDLVSLVKAGSSKKSVAAPAISAAEEEAHQSSSDQLSLSKSDGNNG